MTLSHYFPQQLRRLFFSRRLRCLLITLAALSTSVVYSSASNAAWSFLPSVFKHSESEPAQKNQVEDLSYGVVLYEFFQKNYFQSMTEIMVAEQQQSMPNHQEFAQVLMGGIQLSYGMDQQAEQTFLSVIDDHANKQNRARGWFYLGKLAYQKNNIATATQSLAKVDKALNRELHDELVFLHEKISLAADPSADAANDDDKDLSLSFKPKLSKDSIYRYYRDYNRAVKAVRESEQRWPESAKALSNLYQSLSKSEDLANREEVLALRDKVLTSLGYLQLKMGNNSAAINRFRKVRQTGTQSGKALVGYGWAAINEAGNTGNYEQALTPWLALQSRSMAESSTHEALLAVPFIYEAVDLNQNALQAYDLALDKMRDELAALADLRIEIDKQGYLVAFATSLSSSGGSQAPSDKHNLLTGGHWLDADASLIEPDALDASPLKAHLSELLATSAMRTLFGQLNDIYWLDENLQSWQQRVETFDFAVKERQARNQRVLSGIAEDELNAQLADLQQQRDHLALVLSTAADFENSDGLSLLLSVAEKKSIQRIEQALAKLDKIDLQRRAITMTYPADDTQSRIEASADASKLSDLRLQLNKMKNIIYWQASADRVERVWDKQKILSAADTALAEAQQRMENFPALAAELTGQAKYLQQLAGKRERISVNINALGQLKNNVEATLASRLHQEITSRENRLKAYVGQVRLSKAVLLERRISESSL
jgi:hypothetical protein